MTPGRRRLFIAVGILAIFSVGYVVASSAHGFGLDPLWAALLGCAAATVTLFTIDRTG